MSELDQDALKHVLRLARARGFACVKVRSGDARFSAVLDLDAHAQDHEMGPASVSEAPEAERPEGEMVLTAPVVGYFREGKHPLEVGTHVDEGDAVGEVVALGISNEVASPVSGEVLEIYVKPGDAVEFGQPVVKVGTA